MKLCPQCLNNKHPIRMSGQTPSRRATNAMLAVQLDIQGIKNVTPRGNRNLNAIIEYGGAFGINGRACRHFVKFKRDLTQIIKFRDCGALDFCFQSTLKDAVE